MDPKGKRSRLLPRLPKGGAAVFIFLLAAAAAPAQEQVFTVRMTGSAEGAGASARKLAVDDAQQQVLIEAIRSVTGMEDLTPFKAILGHASGYIQRYDLLRCDVDASGTRVEIDAHVLEKPLRQDAAAVMLPRLPRKPSVLLVVAERVMPDAPVRVGGGDAAKTLREGLEKYGFTLSGPEEVADVYPAARLAEITAGGVETGSRLARENMYDVVITGTGSVAQEPLPNAANVLRSRGSVAVRVFSGLDGKMADAMAAEAVVQSVSPEEGGAQVLSDAAAKLIGDTTVSVVLAMLARQEPDSLFVSVEKPGEGGAAEELAGQLRTLPGVAGVEMILASPALARLRVQYEGPLAQFADMLHTLSTSAGTVEIRRAVGREITLILK